MDSTGDFESLRFQAHDDEINEIVFSSDGRMLVSAGDDGNIRIWDVNAQASDILSEEFTADVSFKSVAAGSNGHWIAAAGAPGDIYLWDMTDDNPTDSVQVLSADDLEIARVRISPDGRWLASGGADAIVRVWDLDSSDVQASVLTLKGHSDVISDLGFSKDGNWLASISRDDTARLWRVSESGISEPPFVLGGHSNDVFHMAFANDNQRLVTADNGGLVQIWNLDTPDPSRSATTIQLNRPAAAFELSADSRYIFTGGQDGYVPPGGFFYTTSLGIPSLWLVDTNSLVRVACQTVGRNLSLQEFRSYMTEPQYRKTCQELSPHISLLNTARDAAVNNDVTTATELFDLFVMLDNGNSSINPTIETSIWLAQGIIEEANLLARQENLDEAAEKFTEALELDPTLDFDPVTQAKKLAAPEFAWRAFVAAANRDMDTALDQIAQALELDPEINRLPEGLLYSTSQRSPREMLALGYNLVCEEGLFAGLLGEVEVFCNESINLDSETDLIRRGRGITKAIRGDFSAATEDLTRYVSWLSSQRKGAFAPEIVEGWQFWLQEVEAGRNPFTSDVLTLIGNEGADPSPVPDAVVVMDQDNIMESAVALSGRELIRGTITSDDRTDFDSRFQFGDVYRFEVVAGEAVAFQIKASSIGSEIDSIISLYDESLRRLAESDDTFGYDAALTYSFVEPGTYFLAVRDFWDSYGDESAFFYQLSLDRLMFPTPIVNVSGVSEFALPLEFNSIERGSITRSDYKRLENPGFDPSYRFGDMYSVELRAHDVVRMQTIAKELGSKLNPGIWIYDASYNFLTRSTQTDNGASTLFYEAETTGTYYIWVRDINEQVFGTLNDYFYEISLQHVEFPPNRDMGQ